MEHFIKIQKSCNINPAKIKKVNEYVFEVPSESEINKSYTTSLGNKEENANCTCYSWGNVHLPCKHMVTVMQLPGISWESFGEAFRRNPTFSLDEHIVGKQYSAATETIFNDEETNNAECTEKLNLNLEFKLESRVNIKPIKNASIEGNRNIALEMCKNLIDVLHVTDNEDDITKCISKLNDSLILLKRNIPKKNNISLNKVRDNVMRKRTNNYLPKRKRKDVVKGNIYSVY